MINEKLKQIMLDEWQKARKSFHFPQLPQPQLVEDIKNGMMNMENLEVKISQSFIEGFRGNGIAERDEESDALCMNECLTHELTHFMRYPGSVLNILRLQKSAQGLTEGDKISGLREAFTEAQTNIYLTNERKHLATAKMRKVYGLEEGDSFGRLMYGLYQEVSGQNFGVELTGEEKGLVDKLKEIKYIDKTNETGNFRRFVKLLKDYQPPEQKSSGKGRGKRNGQDDKEEDNQGEGDGNQGNGQGNQGLEKMSLVAEFGKPAEEERGLDMFTNNQIREGLRQFACECSNPQEYEEVVRQVLGEGDKGGKKQTQSIPGGSKAGIERRVAQLANNFYTARAEKYCVPIRKKPMHKNGGLYPHSHTDFQVGDSITEVDAFSTPKILPGITKKWIRKEGEVYGNEESVPDIFIAIDNSGSMTSPIQAISIPVLGGTVISNAYLDNGSRAAVYSFGGNDELLLPTRDKEAVHKQLRLYTGGGTIFNPKFLEEILKQSEKEFDISVISDMAISNLDTFVNSVLGIPQTHRVHLFYTENNNYVNTLKKSFESRENVAILPLICEGDIKNITMGELKKSIR